MLLTFVLNLECSETFHNTSGDVGAWASKGSFEVWLPRSSCLDLNIYVIGFLELYFFPFVLLNTFFPWEMTKYLREPLKIAAADTSDRFTVFRCEMKKK